MKHEIIAHAEQEAHSITAQAKEQAKKDMQSAHAIVDAFDTDIQAQLQKELEQMEKKYSASMKLLSKKYLLQKRKEILEEVFAQLRTTLSSLPKAEKKALYDVLYARAKKQCTAGNIYCAKQDIALVKTLASAVVEQPMVGGIIVESKDGNYLIDYSFDSMIAHMYEQKLQEVTAQLFGE